MPLYSRCDESLRCDFDEEYGVCLGLGSFQLEH